MTPRAPQPRTPLASTTPEWLHQKAIVYDTRLKRWGVVMEVHFPGMEARQSERAWLRPPGGGVEWNPPIDELSPTAPAATEPYDA